jgi:diguanylate cyclase (GGDEF)-like protein
MRGNLPRLSLLGRFSLLSLAAICLTGAIVGSMLHERIEHRAISAARELAEATASTGARANLTEADLRGPLSEQRMRALDRSLARPLAASGVAQTKVFGADGRVRYSDDRSQIGGTGDEVAEVLGHGSTEIEMAHGTSDDGAGERMIEFYVPVTVGAGSRPNAVFEVYFPYAPIAAGIAQDTRMLALLLGLGLLLLWLSIFRLVARASRRLARQAKEDHLTGLPNRAALHTEARRVLGARRQGTIGALLLIDLDRFKEVNDTLGHDQGDALLCEVSERLRGVLRPADVLARLGGDEFAILVRDLPHRGATAEVTTRVRNALEKPFELCGVSIELEASIGVALAPEHGTDLTTLLRRADVAMYDAKRSRDGVRTYDPAQDPYSPARLALVAELRNAIERDELVLHFQPKITIDGGALAGVEALVRWQHPSRGLLAPIEFVPLAERTGVIGAITDWVLETALMQCRSWRDEGLELPIAVNLSGADLMDAGLPGRIGAALQRSGLPGELLECEISEDTVLAEPHRAIESLRRLRAMGVRISLDDFGKGQSSMSYLKRLPLDQIKVDRSFVMGMHADPSDAAIVRTTIDLGRHLGLEVVAEGVESDEILGTLRSLQCDVAQGFGLSRPLPAADLEQWIAERRGTLA